MGVRIEISTGKREVLLDITERVNEVVASSGISQGWALVYCPHTTAGITLNEHADPDVGFDIGAALSTLVPQRGTWRHSGEGNADAHVKATIVGSSVTVPVEASRLALGTWQGVFFCEFDGPRSRTVHVSVQGV